MMFNTKANIPTELHEVPSCLRWTNKKQGFESKIKYFLEFSGFSYAHPAHLEVASSLGRTSPVVATLTRVSTLSACSLRGPAESPFLTA